MILRKVIYFILTVISIIFYILFIEKLSFYTMVFVIALPAALAIILIIAKFNIKCSLSAENKMTIKNDNCKFYLKIKNKSIFPFPMTDIKIEYLNKISGAANNMYISVPIHSHTTQTICFSLSSDYCGIMNVKVKWIRLTDYIKLFSCKVKAEADTDVFIIPEISSENCEYNFKSISTDESEKFSKTQSGDDPSEIFELKNYVPGDKINRIHWNLSSKQNQLITKYYSQGISSPTTIIPDFDFESSSLYEIDGSLEIFYGISYIFTENEIIHNIYISSTSEIVSVSNCNTLNECYVNILSEMKNNFIDIDAIRSISENQSQIYIITNKRLNEYPVTEFISNGEIHYIFISDSFEKSEFIHSDNMKISKLPAAAASDYIEKILL